MADLRNAGVKPVLCKVVNFATKFEISGVKATYFLQRGVKSYSIEPYQGGIDSVLGAENQRT